MPSPNMMDQFNTSLTPEEESQFLKQFPDPSNSFDYDLRGAFKAGLLGPQGTASDGTKSESHLPDTFKKPNHPTFSNESQYHGKGGLQGGSWNALPNGKWSFTPGATNLQNYSPEELQQYFQKIEPGNQLIFPQE